MRSTLLTWTLRLVLAALFLYEGADKFSDRRLWIFVFEQIGIGQWFRFFTGGVEIAGAVMVLIPRATLTGVALLACTMCGALLVHVLVVGVGPQTVAVGILLILLCVLGAAHVRATRAQVDPTPNVRSAPTA